MDNNTTTSNEANKNSQFDSNINSSDKLVEATGLCKSYHGRQVVNNVDLYAKAGEVVGLLGPNGA